MPIVADEVVGKALVSAVNLISHKRATVSRDAVREHGISGKRVAIAHHVLRPRKHTAVVVRVQTVVLEQAVGDRPILPKRHACRVALRHNNARGSCRVKKLAVVDSDVIASSRYAAGCAGDVNHGLVVTVIRRRSRRADAVIQTVHVHRQAVKRDVLQRDVGEKQCHALWGSQRRDVIFQFKNSANFAPQRHVGLHDKGTGHLAFAKRRAFPILQRSRNDEVRSAREVHG